MHRTDTLFYRIFKARFFLQCSFMEVKDLASSHMLGKVYLKVEKLYKGVQAFGLTMVRRSKSSSTVGSPLNIQPWLLLIPYFVRPRFVCYTLKNPKILFSSHWAMRTSTMTWCNPFGHWST